ncbi:MAG: HAD hydrolase-like protein [Lachnospiraceae bacterium]|nr:HAD hydrolase-like protein [Lachnospiraceae bacterium]
MEKKREKTESRIRWAGLVPEDFEMYTAYENTNYAKPNPDYYRDLMNRLGLKANECIMVGNDVDEDMIAKEVGMNVFLLSDCIVNRKGKDISVYPNGNCEELEKYISLLL